MSKTDNDKTPAATDAVEMPRSPALNGAAVVTPTPIPVYTNAVWEIDENQEYGKHSKSPIFGGLMRVYRKPSGALHGSFEVSQAEGDIKMSIPLHDVGSVSAAQRRCEALVRETLPKTHPELFQEVIEAEHAEIVAAGGDDPF